MLTTAGVAALGFGGGSDKSAAADDDRPPATTEVSTTDLVERQTVDATLGYGAPQPLHSSATGTVTWLPKLGSEIGLGDTAFKADGRPIPLLYGDTPLYRELKPGVQGEDAAELERSLARLGYAGFMVDKEYTAQTAAAVRRWQRDLGVPRTGTITPRDAVVNDGRIRVTGHEVTKGQQLTSDMGVLTFTDTVQFVSIDLDAKKQKLVHKGDKVSVVLPDGSRAEAVISVVGKVASPPDQSGGEQGDQGGGKSVIKVTVKISKKDRARLGSFDGAPVDVEIISQEKKGVLTVPVSALLALSEGGYGVQVVDGTTTRIVAVRTGMFADGKVEITGEIKAGDKVGIPK
ncbi:peptidoglycan-binding protein [Streptomyces sp. TRM66268-LWL]|uniref:Peptidoglycan-binding protein n=1 Tax=Streptomyces polyasparticus TaxID=2767826 RepID=A0ABR7SVQ7_9ACTN|nr:peptidoglycan-binding protein [Streptomyces polyasparticus]MBC9719570.1 peptidoglycan-binding protein [Streptomyces polyasparticus]